MKFFVEVNSKYLVSVEANSKAGAEHVILDGYYANALYHEHGLMTTALSYDVEDMKGNYFRESVMNLETCSAVEFEHKLCHFKEILDDSNMHLERQKYAEQEIENKLEKIESLKQFIVEQKNSYDKLQDEIENLKIENGVQKVN